MAPTRTCFLLIAVHMICTISAQEMDKRVPQGFLGMRGKKYMESEEPEQFYKRKPQFFVGVKGKKSNDATEYNEVNYKRAPMGFIGMRGKKEMPELILLPDPDVPVKAGSLFGQIDYSAKENGPSLDSLISDYIQRLQGSNLSPERVDDDALLDEYDGITNEVEKRGLHQFYGVRGKKSAQSKRPYDLSFRGKFIGVRGKKDGRGNGAQEIKFLLGQNGPWPKRKAQMGFFGMRGKKWTDGKIVRKL